ncbi:MAG TPA: glycosyltransferase family 2 protein [Vicinamibacterales bacterium]|nr:glycosyltransferase family 2 protein [Vicinamibacterales bacterium]
MTLTIAIVTFNARDHLERCLESIAGAPPATPHDVVIVDNGSTDGAPEMVAQRFPSMRLIRARGNIGFGAANNVAIRQSQGDLVLLLNPDTVVPRGAIDGLVAELERAPDAAAIGPRLVDADGRAELSFGPMPSPLGEAWQKLLGWAHARGIWPVTSWVEHVTSRPRAVAWASAACLLLRRAEVDEAGLFDERYFLYWEDVDLCTAMRARGRTVRFTPAVQVVHARGRSSIGRRPATRLAYRRGQLAFYRKWRPAWAPVVAWYLRARGEHPEPLAGDGGTHG